MMEYLIEDHEGKDLRYVGSKWPAGGIDHILRQIARVNLEGRDAKYISVRVVVGPGTPKAFALNLAVNEKTTIADELAAVIMRAIPALKTPADL